ncbi:MAG: orotidine 5'-phosphate decarboxylase / HUMPS family protein, partial [Polyangiaceae bacterium]
VTVLTSLDETDLAAAGIKDSVSEHALRLAKIAFEAGIRTFVCSPKEAKAMRAALGHDATLITPGVRPKAAASRNTAEKTAKADDQKRIASAYDAIHDGADYVVVGRPIRDAEDPAAAVSALAHEIEAAL